MTLQSPLEFKPDPHRPQYHFLPPANWMNDPNGLIQWEGIYHLFYQHNPDGPFFGKMHWGHAVSRDLVHWRHLPLALSPTPNGFDAEGCWSGCIVNNHGIPTAFYTGIKPEVQCMATGNDDLTVWAKHPTPVIKAPPENMDLIGFRDPRVWAEDDHWNMIVGAGIKGVGGAVLLYQSADLVNWRYQHPLYVNNNDQAQPVWSGPMWECPDFFPVGDKHVLVISTAPDQQAALYFIGTYKDQRFVPEKSQFLDYGIKQFFAPQTLLDNQGRRLMWGWLWEARNETAQGRAGWSGAMSLPRVLSLRNDGRLGIEPASEIELLRGRQYQFTQMPLTATSTDLFNEIQGDCLEIIAEFDSGSPSPATPPAQTFGLKVRCSADETEQTLIVYDRNSNHLEIRRDQSSLDPDTDKKTLGGSLPLQPGETLKLRIFLDRSVIEVFANGWCCISARIYPTQSSSLAVKPYVPEGSVMLKSLQVWEMGAIWE